MNTTDRHLFVNISVLKIYFRYSKVLESNLDVARPRPLPKCPQMLWATPVPLNKSAPSNLYKSAKLLSVQSSNLDVSNLKINRILPGLEPLSGGFLEDLGPGLDPDLTQQGGTDDEGRESGRGSRGKYALLVLILAAFAVVGCQYWHSSRGKPKRRRNRFRKILQAIGHRVNINNV